MYGLILEGIIYGLRTHFGDKVTESVLARAKMSSMTFTTHERYSEKIIPDLLIAVCEETGASMEAVGILCGRYFVHFMILNGYGDLLQVMGRRLSDFLKGLDNMHDYFRFSYPKIRPPSFYCTRETATGLTLHYRSRRQGFIAYMMGQLMELGRIFYGQNVSIQVLKKDQKGSFQFVSMKIRFDNISIDLDRQLREKSSSLNEYMPVESGVFLKMFPYFIVYNKKMEIRLTGDNLHLIMPSLVGKRLDEQFDLQQPAVTLSWDGVVMHLNCMFTMESLFPVQKAHIREAITVAVNDNVEEYVDLPDEQQEEDDDTDLPYLLLRGPTVHLKDSEVMLYLPTIVVPAVDDLHNIGLFLNDYGEADCNREIIMASVQKSDDLKEMLRQEKERSMELTNLKKEMDSARVKALELLCTMLPRHVAHKLLTGGETGVVCDKYDAVTILFAKVVDFPGYTNKLQAVEVVTLLNMIYNKFDDLIDKHGVYKVETIGECYMISCGVPTVTKLHAEYIGDIALDMLAATKAIDYPPIGGRKVQIKIGLNSGACVGAVVGHRAPRFCLFGDTVNCASRMESHNKQNLTIQLSSTTKDAMEKAVPGKFKFKHRGMVNLKGKGEVKAFGLTGKAGRARYLTDSLSNNMHEDHDGDEEEDRYSVIEEDENRTSILSRMSISSSFAGSRLSRVSTRQSGGTQTPTEIQKADATENTFGGWVSTADQESITTVDATKLMKAKQQDIDEDEALQKMAEEKASGKKRLTSVRDTK